MSGGGGVHNLSVFHRPDLGGRVFVAATFLETTATGAADTITGENFWDGWLKIVEITDPTAPEVVATWGIPDHEDEAQCMARGYPPGDTQCMLHDVQISDNGGTAYLAYMDAGVVLIDIVDVENPTLIGQWFPPEDRCERGRIGDVVDGEVCEMDDDGATHTVVPVKKGGRHLVLVTDEEWSPPLQGFLRVVDVTDPDPAEWRQTARYLPPNASSQDDFYFAHQPWPGPNMPGGGDIYLSAHADGLRVLSLAFGGTEISEIAWFVPDDDDHADDIDDDDSRPDDFEGSTTIRHPITGELLILAVDVARGLYVLEPSLRR